MPRSPRRLTTLALALAMFLSAAAGLAHGGEEGEVDALDLATQAVAFLRAEPPDPISAADRIEDSLMAEEAPDDVDLRLVEAAGIALERGAEGEAIQLLERAAGIEGEPLGPVVTVTITPGTYVVLAVAALLVGLGAFGLGVRRGRRVRPTAATVAAHG